MTPNERKPSNPILTYRDAAGLVADFHSLRHLYLSRIVRRAQRRKLLKNWLGMATFA